MQRKLIIIPFVVLFATSLIAETNNLFSNKESNHSIAIGIKATKGKNLILTPGKTCLRFLRWYVANKSRLGDQRFFNTISNDDTITPIAINLEYVKKYKAELKKTGFVSDGFLRTIQLKYDSAANYLKANPSQDKPIIDIETDPVIQLAEPRMLYKHIEKLHIASVTPGDPYYYIKQYYVTIRVSRDLSYVFVLIEQNKKWLIDSIVRRFS